MARDQSRPDSESGSLRHGPEWVREPNCAGIVGPSPTGQFVLRRIRSKLPETEWHQRWTGKIQSRDILTAMKPKRRFREVPIDKEVHDGLMEQREAFIAKFGREPGPDDPIFFDPDADTPQPVEMDAFEKEIAMAMAAAGIDPALIYASAKTGLIVTEDNQDQMPEEALEEWEEAIREYQELTKGKPS